MPNPFAHIELTTTDLDAAKKFYAEVFAWKLNDVPAMNYTMIDVAGGTGGGMQSRPMPDAPTGWMPYVEVDDVNATIATAEQAGAVVMLPFQDIGEMGAIGVFQDPNGHVIGVWQPKRSAPSAKAASEKPKASKAPAKKAPAKKAPSKPAAKKAAAKPAAKKAPAKPPAKKAAAKPAPAKKAPAKKAPAKKAPPKPAAKKKG